MVAAFFVPVAVDLEEHCSSRLIEAEITDFVNDKEPWLGCRGRWRGGFADPAAGGHTLLRMA